MSARRYLALFAATFVALGTAAASINLLVDPYIVFGSPRIEGLNRVKADISDFVRTAKAFEPFRHATDVLLAGNSRIELGLNPGHACFAKQGLRVYNLGIPGAGVGQQLNYVLNVIYRQPVQQVFLTVDFVDFLVREGTSARTGDRIVTTGNLPLRFDGTANTEYRWATAKTRFQALLSLNALVSSVKTIQLQGPNQADRESNGFNPARDFAHAVEVEGPGALFQQKMSSLALRFAQPMALHYANGRLVHDFELVSQFLEIAGAYNVDIVLLTNPFHEQFWELLRDQGLLQVHADWLVEIERRVRAAPGRVELWDFSADSSFIHEAVPAPGVKVPPLDWFWEPAHYRRELGNLMLSQMLGKQCDNDTKFGTKLVAVGE